MKHSVQKRMGNEAGFTLVELAVVMVIIGLLIGGILKGQEMIANAQVTSTIAQTKALDAATGTFRDIYAAFPGDMAAADTRLAGVAAANSGDGNLQLNSAPFAAAGTEVAFFFEHLEAADLLAGVNAASYLDGDIQATEMRAGFTNGGALGQTATARRGHYITIVPAGADGGAILTPLQAARIDRKVDDGVPTTGSAFTDVAGCTDAGTGEYDEENPAATCSIAVRIQG